MEIEKTEFGFKVTVPLLTEDEIKIINNDFDNTINKFLKMIIKDKDLATAQYIIEKQQEQINELKRNSIPKKKIEEYLIEETEKYKVYKKEVNKNENLRPQLWNHLGRKNMCEKILGIEKIATLD